MKANLIEITVSGRTGCGKSEVLQVIHDALRKHYGASAKITGDVNLGAIDDAKTTGQTASKKKTIFALYEQNVSGEIRVHD